MARNILDLYPQYKNDRQNKAVNFECNNKTKSYDIKYNADLQLLQDTFKAFKPKLQELKQHIDDADSFTRVQNHKMLFAALSPITPIRRIASLEDNVNDGNYARAGGLVALAVANFPEDCRDIRSAYKQVFTSSKPLYDYTKYQHPFSFFRGTLFEGLLKFNGKISKKISEILYKADKPLYETKLGQILGNLFKIELSDAIDSKIIDIKGRDILAYSFKGNFFQKTLGRAMLRVSKPGIYALALLELPAIIKSFFNPKNNENNLKSGSKQVTKSAINIVSIISGIGIGGAIFARKWGAVGSLIGMGFCSAFSSYVSKQTQKTVDRI